MKRMLPVLVGVVFGVSLAIVTSTEAEAVCPVTLNTATELQTHLASAATGTGISVALGPGTEVGGLFGGTRMWGAVVDRDGVLCLFATGGSAVAASDPDQVWPGSQAIAKAKAYAANAFSLDTLALSTALLYTFTQPGHSLFGLNNSNPFNPNFLAPPAGTDGGLGKIAGGIITFGGGVPLYNATGQIIGGLGVSGDTACADHEVAKRVRDLAVLNPPGGPLVDDIVYTPAGSVFAHPRCLSTLKNGKSIGNERP